MHAEPHITGAIPPPSTEARGVAEQGGYMARRPNYGFEKRQKEMDRQKKKDAKTERKETRRKEAEERGGEEPDPGEEGVAGDGDADREAP
jgi:hypothetical protein